MEVIDILDNNGADQVEKQENDRITTAFEFCEAIDEVRLKHLEDIEWDEETGNDYLIARVAEESDTDYLLACVEWYANIDAAMPSSAQTLQSVLLERVRYDETIRTTYYRLAGDGQVWRFAQDFDPEPSLATPEDVAGLRRLLGQAASAGQEA